MALGAGHSLILVAEHASSSNSSDVLNTYATALTDNVFDKNEALNDTDGFMGSGYAAFYYSYGCHLSDKNKKRILTLLASNAYGWNGDLTDSDNTNNAPSFNTENLRFEASVVTWFLIRIMALDGQTLPWASSNQFKDHNVQRKSRRTGVVGLPLVEDMIKTNPMNRNQDYRTIIQDQVMKSYGALHGEWSSSQYAVPHIALLPLIANYYDDATIARYAKLAYDATVARYAAIWIQNQRLTLGGRDYKNYQDAINNGPAQVLYPWFGPNVVGAKPLSNNLADTKCKGPTCSNKQLAAYTALVFDNIIDGDVFRFARSMNEATVARDTNPTEIGEIVYGIGNGDGSNVYFYKNYANRWGVYSLTGNGVDSDIGHQNSAPGVLWRSQNPDEAGGHFVWGSPHNRYMIQSFKDAFNPNAKSFDQSFGTEGPGLYLRGQQWFQKDSTVLYVGDIMHPQGALVSAVAFGHWTEGASIIDSSYAEERLNGAYRLVIAGDDQPIIVVSSKRPINLDKQKRLMGINADASGQFGMVVDTIDRSQVGVASWSTRKKVDAIFDKIWHGGSTSSATMSPFKLNVKTKKIDVFHNGLGKTGSKSMSFGNLFKSQRFIQQGNPCLPESICGNGSFVYFMRSDANDSVAYMIKSSVRLTFEAGGFNKGESPINSIKFSYGENPVDITLTAIFSGGDHAEDILTNDQWQNTLSAIMGSKSNKLNDVIFKEVKQLTIPIFNNTEPRVMTESRYADELVYKPYSRNNSPILTKVFVPYITPVPFKDYEWGGTVDGVSVTYAHNAVNTLRLKQKAYYCPLMLRVSAGASEPVWRRIGGLDDTVEYNRLIEPSIEGLLRLQRSAVLKCN